MILPDHSRGAYHPDISPQTRKLTQERNIAAITEAMPMLLEQIQTNPAQRQAVPVEGLHLLGNTSDSPFLLTYHPPIQDAGVTSFAVTINHEDVPSPIGSYRFRLAEADDRISISANIDVAAFAQGNGYGTALLKHDIHMLHAFLIAQGYHQKNATIYVSITDGATAYHGLEALNPYYSRDNWTSMIVGEHLMDFYTTDRTEMRRYTPHTHISAVYVIKDPARGIDNLSKAS